MRPVLLALSLATAAAAACRMPNPDHCVHKHVDSDAWCARNVEGRPFCSPCAEEQHGCVDARPDEAECPAYAPDSTGADPDTSTGADTSTG